MLERARLDAATTNAANAKSVQADVQTHAFEPAMFDAAISRFGVMFFDDPHAAFSNIATALRAGGQFTFVCWQELLRNDWLLLPGIAAAEFLPLPEPGIGPGPFALADLAKLEALLDSSGFTDITIESFETQMLLGGGGTLDNAVEFLMNSGAARAVFDGASPDAATKALAASRAVLEANMHDDGARLGAATWIVNARKH